MSRTRTTLAAVGLCLLGASASSGQEAYDFVFSNPGARSTALGGAFVALADDATAAFANPAGLIQLLRPEISVEGRVEADFLDSDEGSFSPVAQANGLGFASFVWPGRTWSLAAYTHSLASFELLDLDDSGDPLSSEGFTVVSYGVAGGFEISERLSVGAGLSYFSSDLEGAFGVELAGDSDWGVSAGLLWRASRSWRVGGHYRQGPEFDFGLTSDAEMTAVAIPDVHSAGVAYQPGNGSLTLGLQWDSLRYPELRNVDGSVWARPGPADRIHLGGEYVFLDWAPVTALRAGTWIDSDRPRLRQPAEGPESEDVLHGAFGFGMVWTSFQLDVGFDLSKRENTLSVSMIFSL